MMIFNIQFHSINWFLMSQLVMKIMVPIIPSAPYVLTGDIPRFQNQTSDVLMITGASDNHEFGSFNFLFSMV